MSVETRTIKPTRSLFTNVIKARKYKDPKSGKEVGEANYDITLLLDKQDCDALLAKALEAAAEKWPGRDAADLALPFKRTEKIAEKRRAKLAKEGKTEEEITKDISIYPPGHFILKAKSKFPVLLCYSNGERIVTIDDDEKQQFANKFYNGCIVSAVLDFVTYDAKKDDDKDGVTTYLKQVFWVGPGERIGGNADTSAFNEYIGTVSNEDPTGGADEGDGLPF